MKKRAWNIQCNGYIFIIFAIVAYNINEFKY